MQTIIVTFFIAALWLCLSVLTLHASPVINYNYDAFGRQLESSSPETAFIFTYDNIGNRRDFSTETVTSAQYLADVIKILQIVVGVTGLPEAITDIDSDGKIGLTEAIYGMQVVGGQQ